MKFDTTLQELTSLRELAREARISYRTLHRYARLGRIKTIRLGALIRVPRKEVERILTQGF